MRRVWRHLICLIFFDFTHEQTDNSLAFVYDRRVRWMNILNSVNTTRICGCLTRLTFENVNNHGSWLGVGWNARVIPRMVFRCVQNRKLAVMEVWKKIEFLNKSFNKLPLLLKLRRLFTCFWRNVYSSVEIVIYHSIIVVPENVRCCFSALQNFANEF